jgi:hypothetical protein
MKIGVIITVLLLLSGLAAWFYRQFFRSLSLPSQPRTIEQVVSVIRPPVEHRIRPVFERANLPWPPRNLTLIAFKTERRLELYSGLQERPHFVCSYPILAASGTIGPKLREGDRQVPEGFYRIELLNPNSRYHLSLRVNYPNADDIDRAHEDGRDPSNLGGDIMIHGGAASLGCLALGDPAVEELFVLAALVGLDNIQLIIAPLDFRHANPPAMAGSAPLWAGELHERLRRAIEIFPLSESAEFK